MCRKILIALFIFGFSFCSQSQSFLQVIAKDSITDADRVNLLDAVYANDTVYCLCNKANGDYLTGADYLVRVPLSGKREKTSQIVKNKEDARYSTLKVATNEIILIGYLFGEGITITDYLSSYDKNCKINHWNLKLGDKTEGWITGIPSKDGIIILTNANTLLTYRVTYDGQIAAEKQFADENFNSAVNIFPMSDGNYLLVGWGVKKDNSGFLALKKVTNDFNVIWAKIAELPAGFELLFAQQIDNGNFVVAGNIKDKYSSIPQLIYFDNSGNEISRQICHPDKDMYKKSLRFFTYSPTTDGNKAIITGEIEKTYGSMDYQTILFLLTQNQLSNQMVFNQCSQFGRTLLLTLPNRKYVLLSTKGITNSDKTKTMIYLLEQK